MLWLTKLFGISTVATIHGLDWQRSKWGNFASHMLKLGEKTAALHADEVIVLSHNMQDYFQETYGRKTRFIPNGINRPILKGDSEIKAKYGLEKDGYILFLARIVPEKGLHYLLHAFEQIETDKKLVIAGGSSHSQEYVQEMVDLAAKDSRVIMTGFVQGEVLEELYSNAYCFVLPSDIEGMALGLPEAMSYGNCCIASNIPKIQRWRKIMPCILKREMKEICRNVWRKCWRIRNRRRKPIRKMQTLSAENITGIG